ncbi:MAG TPA: hypothetical protein VFV78_10265 [Vicinamibacterales bacterium]|nr:hypothetical protein [Vicinamibacterales bacterium]
MNIAWSLAGAALVGYVPGAVIYRLPILDRARRGLLWAEERAFWHVLISVAWSLLFVLVTAALGVYRYEALLATNLALSLGIVAAARGRLGWHGKATKVTIAASVPVIILALGIWRFGPGSEYILGGKDPGVYVNEGIAIDRTGRIFRHDATIAAVPAASRDLFFPNEGNDDYYGHWFMGVYINDPATGEVIPQFPHLLPASIAIGYRIAGIPGATRTTVAWGVIGLIAVYFFGARLIGRLASFFAVLLLALNLVEVWYGRYPNAEVLMQTLLFGGLLAISRTHEDGDPFFGWIAGGLLGLLIFLRFDAYMALAAIAAARLLAWAVRRQTTRWSVILPVAVAGAIGLAYYIGPMRAYYYVYKANLPGLPIAAGAIALGGGLIALLRSLQPRYGDFLTRWLPIALGVVLVLAAAYGLFLRQPGGKLAEYDAASLRIFRDAYVHWPALIAGLAGCVMVTRREFWRDPAFFLVLAAFAAFFFYKIRVDPSQWWMARRFVPMVLPGLFLLASGALFGPSTPEHRRTVRRGVAAAVLLSAIGWQYAVAARAITTHVEYRDAIRQVDQLARRFTPRDLVLIESRNSGSDLHVLGVPLADAYGLNVLVLYSPVPDHQQFERFLADARTRYERIFVLASGGTDLLSRAITATPIAFVPMTLPEYETTSWETVPTGPRQKDLGYSIYQLEARPMPQAPFVLDVGYFDDLQTLRFFARELMEGRSFRWTGPQSFVAASGLTGQEREIELVLHDGGRPAGAPPATLQVLLNGTDLGTINVAFGFRSYRLAIPAEALRGVGDTDEPVQIRLLSSTWTPSDFTPGTDTRQLGVMVDRVEIH